ncbi:MAG: glycerol-3-phosphate 1-O-acyltransferase PlsY [Nitrospirae bacterium]|nr:glycerol-3-phosphate 1-O-acyltransferase PlsY [Nitrospirota bacterium]
MSLPQGIVISTILLMGYLAGSIPFGVIFSRWMAGVDPREGGSRSIGFTNVLRMAGRGSAILTLLGDLGKGYLSVRFAQQFSVEEPWIWLTGLASVLGHNHPVFLGFKGGKGVATGLGVLYGIEPLLGWITVAIWGLVVWQSRYSSLGAIAAFGSLPVLMIWFRPVPSAVVFSLILTAMILMRHTANIKRLLSGTEPKVGRP